MIPVLLSRKKGQIVGFDVFQHTDYQTGVNDMDQLVPIHADNLCLNCKPNMKYYSWCAKFVVKASGTLKMARTLKKFSELYLHCKLLFFVVIQKIENSFTSLKRCFISINEVFDSFRI